MRHKVRAMNLKERDNSTTPFWPTVSQVQLEKKQNKGT